MPNSNKEPIKIYKPYLTISMCADILNCCKKTILNLIERGEIKCIKFGLNKGIRINIEELDKFLEKKEYFPKNNISLENISETHV